MIVGAGPAGLAAALTAARGGARVIIADEQNEFGGSLLNTKEILDGKPAAEWVNAVVAELATFEDVMMLPRSTVNGYHDHNFVTIHERCTDHLADIAPVNQARQKLHRVRAKWVVLATGAPMSVHWFILTMMYRAAWCLMRFLLTSTVTVLYQVMSWY